MPDIDIYWFEGRSLDIKRRIAAGITKVMEAEGFDKEIVTVRFTDASPQNFARGGLLWPDREKMAAK